MKKVIITTGGTGGHIYPALAVATLLKKRGIEVLFVGSNNRMEKDLVPKEDIKFIGLDIHPFSNIKKLFSNIKSIIQGIKLVKSENPDAIIGFGNYISIPSLLGGYIFRKKLYIQEQNADIGGANKWFCNKADKCFLAFDNTFEEISLKYQNRFLVTGNPLRKEIYEITKQQEREKLKIEKNEKVILITGGSLGANSINRAILNRLDDFYKNKNIRLYWATGKDKYTEITNEIKGKKIKVTDIIKPYFDNMVNIMAAADLVICRAGALTISEIIELEKPCILIPYSSEKVGQYQNAKILEETGGGLLYGDIEADKAVEKALEIIEQDDLLEDMSRKIKSLKRENATKKIVENIDIWRK